MQDDPSLALDARDPNPERCVCATDGNAVDINSLEIRRFCKVNLSRYFRPRMASFSPITGQLVRRTQRNCVPLPSARFQHVTFRRVHFLPNICREIKLTTPLSHRANLFTGNARNEQNEKFYQDELTVGENQRIQTNLTWPKTTYASPSNDPTVPPSGAPMMMSLIPSPFTSKPPDTAYPARSTRRHKFDGTNGQPTWGTDVSPRDE